MLLRVVLGDAPKSGVRCVPLLLAAMVPAVAVAGDVCGGFVDPHAYNYCLATQGPAYSGGRRPLAAQPALRMKIFDAPRASVPGQIAPSPEEPLLPAILNMGTRKPGRHKLGGRFLN